MLAAHRVPPQLLGINRTTKAVSVRGTSGTETARNELAPLQAQFLTLNDWLGKEVITFVDYELTATSIPVVADLPPTE